MTLDVLDFIDKKGGNSELIRESQRKRGLPVEIVDEVIKMYADWVKSTSFFLVGCIHTQPPLTRFGVRVWFSGL